MSLKWHIACLIGKDGVGLGFTLQISYKLDLSAFLAARLPNITLNLGVNNE